MNTRNWKELLKQAYEAAEKSPDQTTKVGAVLVNDNGEVLSTGYNGFPIGIEFKPERIERPLKYKYFEHAERRALFEAVRSGVDVKGLTLVCPWAACTECARAIILLGVKKVVVHKQALEKSADHWVEDIAIAHSMLREAGVEIVEFDGEVGYGKALINSVEWSA